MLLNILILEYIAGQRPLQSRSLNRLETFNELSSLISTFHMAFFTDFIQDPTMQHTLGWYLIGVMSLNIFINQAVISATLFKGLYLLSKKYYRRIRHWLESEKKPDLPETASSEPEDSI